MTATAPESRASVRLEESYTETADIVVPPHGARESSPASGRAAESRGLALGGWLLRRMGVCGTIAARRFSRGRVVAAAIDDVEFHAPVEVGDIAVVTGYVCDIGHTSMDVHVDACVERPRTDERREVAASRLSFVAIDGEGERRPVPMLRCRSRREHDLMARGTER